MRVVVTVAIGLLCRSVAAVTDADRVQVYHDFRAARQLNPGGERAILKALRARSSGAMRPSLSQSDKRAVVLLADQPHQRREADVGER